MPAWSALSTSPAASGAGPRILPYGGTFRPGPEATETPRAAAVPDRLHPTYPVFLCLADRPCTVFGGSGAFVAEKVRSLLDAGAAVRLVAELLPAELRRELATGRLVHLQRSYRDSDLHDAFLAIAERDAPRLDAIQAEAARRQVPLNVVDDTPRCSFLLPSIVRRGDLAVAVSTGGMAPALAVRLRQWLERELGPHHARFLELAGRLRALLAARVPSFEARRALWYRLVDSDVLELLAAGDDDAAVARIAEITGVVFDRVAAGEAA